MAILLATTVGYGKPMPVNVSSWEGRFELSPENILIRVPGKPALRMWLYRLPGGDGGSAVGFSSEDGDLLLAPTPEEKGVQPVYLQQVVSFSEDGHVEVLVLYRVQGNGGLLLVEKYIYDGTRIKRSCISRYGGRHDPRWQRVE
jgi:hypothetical protein